MTTILYFPPPRGEGSRVGGGRWQSDWTPTPTPPHKGEGLVTVSGLLHA